MEKRHIINLQGREFVTYEGLLDEAHARGLKSIRTTLVQVPTEANGQIAICTAEIEMLENGEAKTFTGIGDANPRNVNRNIANHLIRMSETRAKARALRDAINVGMAAVEELENGELPAEVGDAPRQQRQPTEPIGSPDFQAAGPRAWVMATREQIDGSTKLMNEIGMTPDEGRDYLQAHFGKTSRLELTQGDMELFIAYLNTRADKPAIAQ